MPRTEAPKDTILVVDDNAANRLLAQAALEDQGYDVILAAGGFEGIAAFERWHPSCVLLDVRMPDLDGFAVCERIRGLPHGAETSVLFLTAQRDVDTFDRALRAGGDDFLTKPIRPTELVVRVQSALKLRQVSAKLREHYDLIRQQRDDRGLGLTFCKVAVEAHRGRIWVEDAAPGAVFCVRLPHVA